MLTINQKGVMHRVPPLLQLDNKLNKDVFEPHLVSIGPYHHGKPELELVEKIKPKAVEMFVEGSNRDREFYLNKIMETIDDVRSCYVEVSTEKYDDAYLANMMLQDGCFILKCDAMSRDPATVYQVGRFLFEYVYRDFYILDNQIPLSILKLLNYPTISDYNGGTLFDDFCCSWITDEWNQLIGDGPEKEPIHLLELLGRIFYFPEDRSIQEHYSKKSKLVERLISKFSKSLFCGSMPQRLVDIEEEMCDSFRSAIDLKERGIHFTVSTCRWYRLEDIKFKSTYFYGELQLPKWNVTLFTKVCLSNLLALENYLPREECVITAYVNIMKILLQSTKDVRELRVKKVLINQLRTDEDLMQVFLDLPVTTWDTLPPFSNVLDELEIYYRKRKNKWLAELMQNYFSSPWTTIALIAAAVLLCLTVVQTYFAIHPRTS